MPKGNDERPTSPTIIGVGVERPYKKERNRSEDRRLQGKSRASPRLEAEGTGVADAGFAGFAPLNAADAEEFFAALLQVRFDGLHVFRRDKEDHADAHIEGL